MRRQRARLRDAGAEGLPVGRARGRDVGHDDRDMVEPADHCRKLPLTLPSSRRSGARGFLPASSPRRRGEGRREGHSHGASQSNPDQVNFDQRPLAEAFVEDAAQSAASRIAHGLVVAAQARRQLVECTFDGAAQGGSRRLGSGRFDYADRTDLRRCQGFAAAIEDQGGNRAAVESDATAVLQRCAADRQQTLTVAGEPADRHLVDNAGAVAASRTTSPF